MQITKKQKSKTEGADPVAADQPFSFGVAELAAAERLRQEREAELAHAAGDLALEDTVKMRRPNMGFDPYNSGSFERDNAWRRVTKRR
jgi:hypothetical protein